jgi:hypothetical protein
MSRGHEVKSVQEQWLDAEAAKDLKRKPRKSPELIEHEKERESLALSRTRIERELAETKSDVRRKQLQAALAHLDEELKRIMKPR